MTRYRSILAWGLILGFLAVQAPAEPTATQARKQHELWIINTRCAPSCGAESVREAELDYQRFDHQEGWIGVDKTAFFDTGSADVPTSFYIHGNRMDPCGAIREGQGVHRLLCSAAEDRSFRLVIWSWPATRIRGRIRNDVRVKAARSDVEAYYLARCVDRMRSDVRLAMMGHSFGARVITGALHMLAGGELSGLGLPERADRPRRALRAVLVAAAVDDGWLLPGRRNGLTLQQVDRMLITQNTKDRVLRWYPRMYGRGGPSALGFTGPACPCRLGEDREKLEVLGMTCLVGRAHGWWEYMCSPALRCRLPWYTFLEPAARCEKADVAAAPATTGPESPPLPEPTAATDSASTNRQPI